MLLSRVKSGSKSSGSSATNRGKNSAKSQLPELEDFLKKRDYIGAITLLEYNQEAGKNSETNDLWVAYCHFHLGDYVESLKVLENLSKRKEATVKERDSDGKKSSKNEKETKSESKEELDDIWLYIACCQFFLGMYKEAEESVSKCKKVTKLHTRLSLHLAHKNGDEKVLLQHHQQLQDVIEDQLCLASIHYLRSHYQEAIDIYKKILIDKRDYLALNVYIALCYYKLDYYDVSQEVLAVYLQQHPDSMTAINLKACNHYRLYNGKAAEVNEYQEAYNLIGDLEPSVPHEYILKGVVNAVYGQEQDTIPGRQSMASCFFLMKQFDDVLLYLSSIKSYFYNDDTFNFTYAQAKAATGAFQEAEETFLQIQSEKIKSDPVYVNWLIRCYIMNKKPEKAWELYEKMATSAEAFNYLTLVANECYKMGHFLYAARSFDLLEKLDSNPEYWEGKRGACCGVFQMIIAERETRETLRDVISLLRSSSNPQTEQIVKIMRSWAKENSLIV
ncbi:intraflagellar transport protein 56-like isoform X2 [Dinothrombium tinctorium]|uniref:Intraflagellar transport protein 56-like isoform X2 n=1 Tax=Dinothrombium tinctorium TaxID=1965070 RepID=A0A443RGG4_9ACAR|nr:intraflagellar transport protein 56-like isoform X2 [Dinothrombium tinctorium]